VKRISKLIALTTFFALAAWAQPPLPQGFTTVLPVQGLSNADLQALIVSPSEVPLYSTTITGYDGNSYTGTFVGRNPNNRAKTTTNVITQVIPLKVVITDAEWGAVTYDATAADACVAGTPSDTTLITNSPIFNGANYTMNGVNVTPTTPSQYIDAFIRANYWSLVGETNYHTNLTLQVLPVQTLNFNSTVAQNFKSGVDFGGGCANSFIGVVDITAYDSAIQALLSGGTIVGVSPGTFPILLSHEVVNGIPGHNLFASCCALGYHSGFTVGPNLQIYSPFSYSSNFGGDVSTLSHEMAEAVMDPTGNNPTPVWGELGQTFNPPSPTLANGGCQNNLEVGDPLSQANGVTPTSFVVTMSGFTYHLQELAFTNWFYGAAVNTGAGGKYSNNGAFGGHAKLCPPGGTN